MKRYPNLKKGLNKKTLPFVNLMKKFDIIIDRGSMMHNSTSSIKKGILLAKSSLKKGVIIFVLIGLQKST